MAPDEASSFSVSVVLPASGCEMIAKVRRDWYGSSLVAAAGVVDVHGNRENEEGRYIVVQATKCKADGRLAAAPPCMG